jgi:hypothetical protein
MKKIQGLHPYRFRDNPEEKRFAEEWVKWNRRSEYGSNLAYLLLAGDQSSHIPPEPSVRDFTVAATVIQWLGSPVGQGFLRDLGYEKRPSRRRIQENA